MPRKYVSTKLTNNINSNNSIVYIRLYMYIIYIFVNIYIHVYWVSFCRSIAVVGSRLRGRGKKSWCECVKSDMKIKGLRAERARDREMWIGLLSGKRSTRASMDLWM